MIERIRKDYKKIIKYLIVAIVVFHAASSVFGFMNSVLDARIRSYHVNEAVIESVPATGIYEKEFLCVGSIMDSIQVEATTTEGTQGTIFYQILDQKGNVVLENIEDVWSMCDERGGLFIDVSERGLIQGERYVVRVDFQKAENLNVTLGSSQLSIRQYFEFAYRTQYMIAIVGLFLAGIVWLYFIYKKGLTAKMFLITSLVVGTFIVFIMPPVSRDDEYRHFLRSYTGAVDYATIELKVPTGTESGIMGATGEQYIATVPYEINELRLMDYEENYNGYGYVQEKNGQFCIEKFIATLKAEHTGEMYGVSATATATRGDVYYWPQIMAMKVAAVFETNDLLMFYVARFGQLLVCVLMEALAIYIAPKAKEMIWLMAFIPNSLLLKSSCNCDGLLISEMILLVAIVVWMKEEKIDFISKKGAIGLLAYLVLTYNITLMKVPYIIACVGLLVYLTKDNFKKTIEIVKENKKTAKVVAIIIALLAVVVLIFKGQEIIVGIILKFLPEEHFYYILGHPGYIVQLFGYKTFEMILNLYVGMKGNNWLNYPVLVVLLLMLMQKRQPIIKRAWFAVLFGGMIVLIVLVGYIMTPADYGVIWGITYRYLLPFMMIGALCLPAGNEKTEVIAQKCVPLLLFETTIVTMISWLVWGTI